MAKDPAFLFYPNDYMGGTLGMTLEEKGAYVDLFVLQFNKGKFSEEEAKRVIPEKIWNQIKFKFDEENGLFFQKRLQQEIEKRKKHSERQRDNIRNRYQNTYQTDTNDTTKTLPLENRDRNENRNENKIENEPILPFDSENFKRTWALWLSYRSEIKQPYKSAKSVQAALKNLSKYTEIVAIEMIEQSIRNQWRGIFEIKNNGTTGQGNNTNDAKASRARLVELTRNSS